MVYENMAYPKIGDIIRNNMAAHDKYFEKEKQYWSRNFIYMGVNGRYVKAIHLHGKVEIDNQAFYKDEFRKIENSDVFDIVGHSKIFDLLKDELFGKYDEEK